MQMRICKTSEAHHQVLEREGTTQRYFSMNDYSYYSTYTERRPASETAGKFALLSF